MLKGPRITLRSVTPDDLPSFVHWLNDRQVHYHLSTPGHLNLDDEREWYESTRKNPNTINFAIETEHQALIGVIGLRLGPRTDQSAEMGIFIGEKSVWGQGYCTEALRTLLDYAFKYLNLNRVHLRVDVDNIGGQTCYRRCGFELEGELRQAIFRDGQFVNQYVMSVLRENYQL